MEEVEPAQAGRGAELASVARQALSFARAYRRLSRHPVAFEDAARTVAADLGARERRFLAGLDRLVWPHSSSPARRLLELAGAEPGDVRILVQDLGLDAALGALRDRGVYVAYEESLGQIPARRGSATLEVRPEDFANPVIRPDFLVSTSGTRSQGTLAQSNFAYVRRQSMGHCLRFETWGVRGAPTAKWNPAFPGGGIGAVLKHIGAGNPPEVWFSQLELNTRGVAAHKRAANHALVLAAILTRGGLPRPRFLPITRPGPALEWVQGALARCGRALVTGYASSWVHMAQFAREQGVSLDGVVMGLAGEPVTQAKVDTVQAAGARAINSYGSVPEGTVAFSCPEAPRSEYLHVLEHDHAVVLRPRPAPDGSQVSALCWTTLCETAPRVLVNVENDDCGTLEHDQPCGCLLGGLGLTTRLIGPRGVSKIVTGGTTLPGEVLRRLAEEILPARFGGGPTDYQFVEQERAGLTALSLRVDPRLGSLDENEILQAMRSALGATEAGIMSSAIWSDSLQVVREAALSARSGKMLPFERVQSVPMEHV